MPDNAEYMAELMNRPTVDPLITGLREIQELHKLGYRTCADEVYELNPVCDHCYVVFPCETRQLADKALGETDEEVV